MILKEMLKHKYSTEKLKRPSVPDNYKSCDRKEQEGKNVKHM